MPQPDVRSALREVLLNIPLLQPQEGRDSLLSDLPLELRFKLTHSNNPTTDIILIVNQVWQAGQDEIDGKWYIVQVMKTARLYCLSNSPELKRLDELIAQFEPSYNARAQPDVLASSLEQIIGRDERLLLGFFNGALKAQAAVARLQVPRLSNASDAPSQEYSLGTGWMIAPNMLITNYHVIAARETDHPGPTEPVLRAQALNSQVWLGYNDKHSQPHSYPVQALEDFHPEIDYALLRLADRATGSGKPLDEWGQLICRKNGASLQPGSRLNIIQHPLGLVKHFAIRSNYFTEEAAPYHIHYLTDTEPGASGSPVMDDEWRVLAMHCASDRITPREYNGEMIFMNNRGIKIDKILEAIRTRLPNLSSQIKLA